MSAKLTDLRAEADRTRRISEAAQKKSFEAQKEVEKLERKEMWEKQTAERREEAQSAVENSTLPKWVIRFIEDEAYDKGHSTGQSEVDSYIIACICSAEEHMKKDS